MLGSVLWETFSKYGLTVIPLFIFMGQVAFYSGVISCPKPSIALGERQPSGARSRRRSIVRKFVEVYRAKYGKQPDFLAAQGFDAATMVLAAAKREKQEQLSFVQAFRRIDVYDGLTGAISVTSSGEVQRSYSVVKFERGRLIDLTEAGQKGAGTVRVPVITEPGQL